MATKKITNTTAKTTTTAKSSKAQREVRFKVERGKFCRYVTESDGPGCVQRATLARARGVC